MYHSGHVYEKILIKTDMNALQWNLKPGLC